MTCLTRKFKVKLNESGKHNIIIEFSRVLDRRISKEKLNERVVWNQFYSWGSMFIGSKKIRYVIVGSKLGYKI